MPNLSSFSKLLTIANSVQHNGLFQKRSIPPPWRKFINTSLCSSPYILYKFKTFFRQFPSPPLSLSGWQKFPLRAGHISFLEQPNCFSIKFGDFAKEILDEKMYILRNYLHTRESPQYNPNYEGISSTALNNCLH